MSSVPLTFRVCYICFLFSLVGLYFFTFLFFFFFFTDTATTEIYTLSLHDALPISRSPGFARRRYGSFCDSSCGLAALFRSKDHTSELESHVNLVCRLLLEKKNKKNIIYIKI